MVNVEKPKRFLRRLLQVAVGILFLRISTATSFSTGLPFLFWFFPSLCLHGEFVKKVSHQDRL